MPAKKPVKKPAKKSSTVFSKEEREAMKEYVREKKGSKNASGESDLLAKIAQMKEPDRALAKKVHALITSAAPELSPRTWYGMPAYTKDGKVLCHFQPAQKFKTRYATFGFSDKSNLDDGAMWPVAFALSEWTADVEAKIATLVKQAVS